MAATTPPNYSMAWNSMAATYANNISPATSAAAYSLLVQLGLQSPAAPDAPALRVLETHCGDALAASMVLPCPRVKSYTATDFSEEMVKLAKARLGDRAEVLEADSTKLPFEDATFDCYVSNMGCCCVPELDPKIKEAYRVVVPGGKIAMSTRIEGGVGETAFKYINDVLVPFGFTPGPQDREGVHIGKDLEAMKARWESLGFKNAVAWHTWATIPVHDPESFVNFALGPQGIQKFLATLDEGKLAEVRAAMRAAGEQALAQQGIQVPLAVIVAQR